MSPPLLELVEPVPLVPVLLEAPVGLLVSLCIRAPPVAVSELIPLIPPPVLSIAAIPVSVFYRQPPPHKVLRFCFAKSEETLARGAEILCKI